MAKHPMTPELDDIAGEIQSLGKQYPRHANRLLTLAASVDTVSNELDRQASVTRKSAATDPDLEQGAWGPEDVYDDSYEADDYHRVPVGNDSLSKAIDKNPADILSDLDFAQATNGKDGHRIVVQAGKNGKTRRRGQNRSRVASSKWPFTDLTPQQFISFAREGKWSHVHRAASMALGYLRPGEESTRSRTSAKVEPDDDANVDLGNFGADDRLSTADMGESGDDDIAKPVDGDQEGGVLQFYGTYAQTANDTGPDSGHHRREVAPPNRETRGDIRAGRDPRSARTILERVADRPVKPEVKQPDDLWVDEPGQDVERDQELGGLSNRYRGRERSGSSNGQGRSASGETEVKVYRPAHVPQEMHGLWHRAATRLAGQGKLLNTAGEVDYYAIDGLYRGALGYYRRQAASHSRGRQASNVRYARTPSNVKIQRPEHVPRELVSYWNGAAEYQGRNNRLVTASGQVDYDGVNRQYIRLLDAVAAVPAD